MRMKERMNRGHLIFGVCAGVLAVLLACAGTAAGATWVVDDDGGAGMD